MRRYTQGVIALLLALASIGLSPLSRPETALADDAEISSCDFTTFSMTLADVQTSGGGTITFACAGTLTFAEVQTITTAVQIDSGGNEVIFDGENETGFFVVESDASLELTGLTLMRGSAENGGAIDNQGTLTVIDSTFSGNNAGTFGDGGAILSNGTLTVTRSHFDNNGARFGGALYASGATITDSSFQNNSASFGAAIRSLGTMTVTASSFNVNQADIDGGAFYNAGELTIIASAFEGNTAENEGGAINSATAETLTVIASTFEGNTAAAHGGAIYNHSGATLDVTASTFEGNSTTGNGGAIVNRGTLIVTASTLSGNQASTAGAIYSQLGSSVITASTFDDNRASTCGTLYNTDAATMEISHSTISNSTSNAAGAICNFGPAILEVTASTISNNSGETGAAIFNGGGTLSITASTLSGNTASSFGGAIYNTTSGTLSIFASTFSGNSAGNIGGAIRNLGTATITGSIVAHNSAPNGTNCLGAVISGGSNLSNDESCNFTNGDIQNSTAINLDELADNGGPTETMLPLNGSDALDNADCPTEHATDQRGAVRPLPPAGCDIGAVEVEAEVPVQIFAFIDPGDVIYEGTPATFQAVAYGPDNDNLVYHFDCNDDGSYESPGACIFPDEGVFTVGLEVCDGADMTNCASAANTLDVTVHNAAPSIDAITTSPSVAGMQVTVMASDPGIADVLSYSFDCDADGTYDVGPQPTNSTTCPLDPEQASVTINVLVADGDGGETTGSVTVSQTATLCVNRYTGALSAPAANGNCPTGSVVLTVPGPSPVTFCISPFTGAISWSPQGACGSGSRMHVVPDDGPLYYCQSLFTGALRYSATGACGAYEQPGVIPGGGQAPPQRS